MKKFYMSFCIYSVFIMLFTSCEKELFVEPKNQLLKIEYGKIYISSKPAGASIYINGRNTGYKTPDTVRFLEDGNANVVLKMKNFWDTTFTLRVQKQFVESIDVDYYANPKMYGNIVCASKPSSAAIYVNNVNTGRVTPDTLERMFPGDYEIKYSYPEFRKDSITLTVRSRITSVANLTLEDTLDIVTYNGKNSGFPTSRVNDITEDKDGNIWAATGMFGPIKFDGKNFTRYIYGTDPDIPSDYATQIKRDKEDNLWIGFSNGLAKYNGSVWEKVNTMGKGITSIFVSDDNTVLAGTDEAGILRYKNGQYDFLTKENSGLPFNQVNAVCMDRQGKIWAALGDYGIGVYDGSSWVRLDSIHNGLPNNQCVSLTLSPEGDMLGIFYRILIIDGHIIDPCPHNFARFDGTKWNIIASKNDFAAVRQIYTDKKNNLWISFAGLMRMVNGALIGIKDVVKKDLRLFSRYSDPSTSILLGKVVFIDSKENLWVYGGNSMGFSYGLVRIKKGRWIY